MPDVTRGERTVQLFALLISNPDRSYSISDLMEALNIPAKERRNVQRDMTFLSNLNGGAYINVSGDKRAFLYRSALKTADRLLFPNFENTMLHYVFLQRIANIYPAASDTIAHLLGKINETLPASEKKAVQQISEDLNMKILFMGTPPSYEEDTSEKLKTVLRAIHEHRKIQVEYVSDNACDSKVRIPLMLIIYQNEIYVACESQSHQGNTYVLKFRRFKSVTLTKETYVENPMVMENLRKRVQLGSAIFGKQDPKAEDIEIIFNRTAKFYLEEKPFHRNMRVKELPDGRLLVTMKVEVNELLFRWVLGYADGAEVVSPQSLREKMFNFSEWLYKKYCIKR